MKRVNPAVVRRALLAGYAAVALVPLALIFGVLKPGAQGRLVIFADALGFAALSLVVLQVFVSGRWALTTRTFGLRSVLSLKSAIDAYTAAGAWASFDEGRKGTLSPGMLADIVVLSRDIFAAPAAAATPLPAARVDVTIFDGKVVYRRSEHGTN